MNDQAGYYREAIDIRRMPAGVKLQIAPDTIVTLPRTGMYKMTTQVILLDAQPEVRPAIADPDSELKRLDFKKDERGGPDGNVWSFPTKPTDDEPKGA